MQQISYLFVIICFTIYLQYVKSQTQGTELLNIFCTEEFYTTNNTLIIWPRSKNFLTVVSEPLCVNKNNILVTRTCLNGQWSPKEHECYSVQDTFRPKCLDNHKLDKNGYCIYISKPQSWTSKVPVVDVELITNLDILNTLFYNYSLTKFWLPVKRIEKYGKFVWTIPRNFSKKYEDYVDIKYIQDINISDFVFRDCMIVSHITEEEKQLVYFIQPEHCKATHNTVHAYKPESRYFVNGTHLIYSTGNNNTYFIAKNCQTLAQPKTKEDNFSIKKLVNNQVCKIGIVRDENGAFKWKNSSSFINYTDWVPSTNFSNSVIVISKDGWKLENNGNDINCSVCQIDYTKYKTELIVELNKNHTQLILTAYAAQKIYSIVSRTTGLEDIDLKTKYNKYDVYHDVSNVQNHLEILDLRHVWRVQFNQTSNYYYFEALLLPNAQKVQTKKIFLASNGTGRDYAFKLKIKKICKSNEFVVCEPHFSYLYKNISNFLFRQKNILIQDERISKISEISNIYITSFRAIKIIKINDDGDIKILYHLEAYSNTTVNITKEFLFVRNFLKELDDRKLYYHNFELSIDYNSVKSCSGCISINPNKIHDKNINWEFTEIGNNYTTSRNCMERNELYFTRKCGGNYLEGGEWEKPERIFQTGYSRYTVKFCNLYEMRHNLTPTEAIQNLANITTRRTDLKPIDIYYIAKIFQNVTETKTKLQSVDLKSFARNASLLINNMIAVNISSLEESNRATNATNSIVAYVEQFLPEITENDLDEQGVNKIIHENYMYSIIDPFVSGITGIALLKPNIPYDAPFTEYEVRHITANTTIDEIISWENLETAIYVPEILLDNIKNQSNNKEVRISISFFYNDSLFIETNITNKSQLITKVFDVTIKGYDNYLFSSLPVISKLNINSSREDLCAYWDFGSQVNNVSARWKADRLLNTHFIPNKNIQICYFKHLTHFALLLGKKVGYGPNEISLMENTNLEIITAVGCVLSTIGICGVFLTAMIFKTWRQKIGTKVILNVSVCIILQIILLYSNIKFNEFVCVLTGSLLHYSVLCGFSWSLIMAVLQYLKFVRVIGGQTPHLLLKVSVIGWILPTIPVISAVVINYINTGRYMRSLEKFGSNICYPQDLTLYLTLILPVCLIVLTNLSIFFIILYSITWRPKIRSTISDKKIVIQQIKLAIFLFFLLGLTWISGLITVVYHSTIFLYLFSASASMQGFVLFLFYVILDQSTLRLWIEMLRSKSTPSKKISQSSRPTDESNTYNTTKSEDGVSLSEVAEWNARVQAVMQELDGTHRVDNGVKSRTRTTKRS